MDHVKIATGSAYKSKAKTAASNNTKVLGMDVDSFKMVYSQLKSKVKTHLQSIYESTLLDS